MYKIVGVIFILLGCAGWGNGKIWREQERIRHLRILAQLLGQMRREIVYGKHTLPEICLLLSSGREEPYHVCLGRIYERMADGEGREFSKVWETEFRSCLGELSLWPDERETVIRLPAKLSFQEEEGQAARVGQAEAFFAQRCRQAEELHENRKKMIHSVSILTGLLLAILLL